MKNSDTQIPEDLNWADYCDALHAERWLRLYGAKRRQDATHRAPAMETGSMPGDNHAEGRDATEERQ